MAKSRMRSRDARKKAAKKRANKERLALKTAELWKSEHIVPNEPKFTISLGSYCSECGAEFGPGNSGYSHCVDHEGIARVV
jgi:hypothetical protein